MIHARVALSVAAFVVLAGASAAGLSPSFYNSGPSSAAVPASNAANVATIRFPREIVNPAVPYAVPSNLLNGSLSVQAPGDETTGVRWRSVATIALFEVNPNAGFQVVANLNFNPRASQSYILFLDEATAATISTLGQLDAFVASPGAQYAQYFLDNAQFGLFDGDLTAANLRIGVTVPASDLRIATPDSGPAHLLIPGAAANFPVAIVVLRDGSIATPTEWIRVRNQPTVVRPFEAEFGLSGERIRIRASEQLVDDAPENPADSDAAALGTSDFRVRPNGAGPAVLLENFLANNLSAARSVAGVDVGGGFRDGLWLSLDQAVTHPGDLSLIRSSTIGFTAGSAGGRVFSHRGGHANGALSTFLFMGIYPGCPIFANADTNGDGVINFADLNTVLGAFGQTGFGAPGDVNDDGVINFADLNAVLGAFGASCD